jgi:hypothetical protein
MAPLVDPLYVPAEVHQHSPNTAPVLSPGRLMIQVLRQFENACRRYFSMKDIAEDERMGKILYNFESAAVQSWVMANEERLTTITFAAFLIKFKKKFLARLWEEELINNQISLQGKEGFLSWANKVRNANTELGIAGSLYHINTADLRRHLVPCLSDEMKHFYHAQNGIASGSTVGALDAITDLDQWQDRLVLIEQDLQADHNRWTAIETSRKATNVLRDSSITNTASSATRLPALPSLTDEEKRLLAEHTGCFKCHRTLFLGMHWRPPNPGSLQTCHCSVRHQG